MGFFIITYWKHNEFAERRCDTSMNDVFLVLLLNYLISGFRWFVGCVLLQHSQNFQYTAYIGWKGVKAIVFTRGLEWICCLKNDTMDLILEVNDIEWDFRVHDAQRCPPPAGAYYFSLNDIGFLILLVFFHAPACYYQTQTAPVHSPLLML